MLGARPFNHSVEPTSESFAEGGSMLGISNCAGLGVLEQSDILS